MYNPIVFVRRAIILLPLCLTTACAGETRFAFKGIAYTSYESSEYLTADSGRALNDVVDSGANWTSLLVTWYSDRAFSSSMTPDAQKTPSNEAVAAAIDDCHARGLKVMLKPQIDYRDGTFRGLAVPNDPASWFSAYQEFITRYAEIAQSHRAELFCVGTEMKQITGARFRANWQSIIAAVRAAYSGPLIYAANAVDPVDEFNTLSFWDLLDIAGLDLYPSLTTSASPSIADLIAAWRHTPLGLDTVALLRNWQSTLRRPVVFTEIGYQSARGTNMTPYGVPEPLVFDEQGQANCYEAAFEVWSQEDWLQGVFWWGWTVAPSGARDTSFSPRGKQASQVIAAWYRQGPAILSGPQAFPNPAAAGQNITFTAAAIGGGTFIWDFGDGLSATAQFPVHAYAAPGNYQVTLTVAGSGTPVSSSLWITVGVGAIQADTDFDGFNDELETGLGTSPTDPFSTPFDGAPSGPHMTLDIKSLGIRVNFAKLGGDGIVLAGSLPIPQGLNPNGQHVGVEVAGVVRAFVLNDRGLGNSGPDRFQITLKRVRKKVPRQTAKFSVKLKGDFAAAVSARGFDNADVANGKRSVVAVVLFNQSYYSAAREEKYSARKGRRGIAK